MKKGNPKAIYLRDYKPPEFLITKVELRFELFAEKTLVHSRLYMRNTSGSRTLELHGEQLTLRELEIDGRKLANEEYSVHEDGLKIFNVPEKFCLCVTVEIDPARNTALEGLYLSSGNYCTQCEAEGFRKITYYIDRPDVMAEFFVRIEADKDQCPIMLSNGNRVDTGTLHDNRHYAQWHDPFPKPSYLFALVAGDLACRNDVFTTKSGREVALEIYTEAHNASKCKHALASLKKAMQWDEDTFGLEYDLDTYMIVAVDDFNMGAMENKGLNVFNSKYVLASPTTATDSDYMGIEGVIAHEYFHNWTGNRVTCRDWFQLSLKEGLTVFRDQEFTSDVTSRAVKRIQDVRNLRTYQFAEDAGPMAHPVRPDSYVEINNFYTLTVYEKGAEVVRMYQTILGRTGFKKGLQHYLSKYDGQAVTTDDFAAAMSEANNFDLNNFLVWYSQSGTPLLEVQGQWREETREYSMVFHQIVPPQENGIDTQPFYIPVKLALFNSKGSLMPLILKDSPNASEETIILHVTKERQEFVFTQVDEPPTPSLLQGFSAPVKLKYDYSEKDYSFLMSHDNDSFNRWEASQQIATQWLLNAVSAVQDKQRLPSLQHFIDALGKTLQDKSQDAAFLAEIMILPSESYLAEQMNPIDVEAIYKVRCEARQLIASKLENTILDIYKNNKVSSKYSYNAQDMGKRRLAAVCLSYLNVLQREEYIELSRQQFNQANNMTDTIAVLEAINDLEIPFREQAMNEFAERWQKDTLVMDKWFSLHARSRRPNVLSTVISLLNHPCFSIKNPNKVRSLIGVFSIANPTGFHADDGSGYKFLAEQVLRLDPINPQVAARLVKAMIDWKKYDVQRQQLMKQELQTIIVAESISRDVYEIVDRSLRSTAH